MKKRVIKKYLNRYINKIIKALPTVDTWAFREINEFEGLRHVAVYANNHIIVNGTVIDEGRRSNGCQDLLKNIRLTSQKANEIVSNHERTYFRLFEIRGNNVRMRLITE